MVRQTKVIKGYKRTIDKEVNQWAQNNGASIVNVTLSEGSGLNVLDEVTATVVYEVSETHPLATAEADKRRKVQDREKAQMEALGVSKSQLEGFSCVALLVFVIFFLYLIWKTSS